MFAVEPFTGGVDGEWRPAWQVSMSAMKAVQRGVHYGSQGQMPPTGLWMVAWAARTSFHVRNESRPEGRLFGFWERMRSTHSNRRDTNASIRSYPTGTICRSSGDPERAVERAPSPLVETTRIICNTYSVPYKGKDLKKRLSPKSLNTLIHQCITFYVFLIFQYLSLWKSVFSPN